MFKTILLLVTIACMSAGPAFAQDSVVSGTSWYLGVGGGLNMPDARSVGTVALKIFRSDGWGLEAGFRRTGVEARNLPDDYIYGRGGLSFGNVEKKMLDDANVWNLSLARRWQSAKHPLVHGMLTAGLSLTDYSENLFTYTGVQSSGILFTSYSSNYSTTIDRQWLPGFYGRAAGDIAIGRGVSLEAGLWMSLTPKVHLFGMELLLNIGRMPHTKIIQVRGRTEKAKARFKNPFERRKT